MKRAIFQTQILTKHILYVGVIAMILSCGYIKPIKLEPVPNEAVLKKSFFFNEDGSKKTFVCGWIPVNEMGQLSEWSYAGRVAPLHYAPAFESCNLQFDIEQNLLIGRRIHPTLGPDQYEVFITIPILNHHNLELARDEYGRPQNKTERRTDKDHWSAREWIELDFKGVKMMDKTQQLMWGGDQIIRSYDEEMILGDNNFMAFSITVSDSELGSHNQADFRFNFLEYKHDPQFEKRYYHPDNSRLFAALYGVNEVVDGNKGFHYITKWDFSDDKIPYTFCLYHFPNNETEQIAFDTIDRWNKALNDVFNEGSSEKKQRTFFKAESKKESKYPFDLRCNSITYVNEKRLTYGTPLGIANLQADTRNGKVLWGSIIIWGGGIESTLQSWSSLMPSSSTSGMTSVMGKSSEAFLANPLYFMTSPTPTKVLGFSTNDQELISTPQMNNISISDFVDLEDENFKKLVISKFIDKNSKNNNEIEKQYDDFKNTLASGLESYLMESERKNKEIIKTLGSKDSLMDLMIGNRTAEAGKNYFLQHFPNEFEQFLQNQEKGHFEKKISNQIYSSNHLPYPDSDKNLGVVISSLGSLKSEHLKNRPIEQMVKVLLLEAMLHEFGHLLGMGHNFKENILRESTPGKVVNEFPHRHGHPASKDLETILERKKKAIPTHYSTIMGYPDIITVMSSDYDQWEPGPQDKMVLQYIYKNHYPLYDGQSSNYYYAKVPNDGRIPWNGATINGKHYELAYYDSCTDMMEAYGLDPYCNKFDRGHDAPSIVKSYFDDFWSRLEYDLLNTTDMKGNPYFSYYNLWNRSLDTFYRVRKFYDYMRSKFSKDIKEIHDQNPANLISFSKCAQKDQRVDLIKEKMIENSELNELCNANKMAVEGLGKLLSHEGADYIQFDNDHYNVQAVWNISNEKEVYDSLRPDGLWKIMSILPVKYSALFTLTTAKAYFSMWPNIVLPINKYTREGENTKFIYQTLYPELFNISIANAVTNNLTFAATSKGKKARIKNTTLFMGHYLGQAFKSLQGTNDTLLFDKDYIKALERSSQFHVNDSRFLVPVFLEVIEETDPSNRTETNHYRAFNAMFSPVNYGDNTSSFTPLGPAYLLPNKKVIFSQPVNHFMVQVSDVMFFNRKMAYFWAARSTYTEETKYNQLDATSITKELVDKYREIHHTCVSGQKLEKYFSKDNRNFKGILILPDIATNSQSYELFLQSLKSEYENYQEYLNNEGSQYDGQVCMNTPDDLSMLVTAALAMNNTFLPLIFDYYLK